MKSKLYSGCALPVRNLLLCLLSLPLSLAAQQNKLIVTPPGPLTVKRAGSAVALLKVSTLPGFHVNSDHPKDEYLIPLRLTWTEGPLESKGIAYPRPETIKLGADSLSVFTGTFEIKTEFAVPPQVPAGSIFMTGKLHYQACNNQMCFRPSTIEVRLPVVVE